MGQRNLGEVFQRYLSSATLFRNKSAVTNSFRPEEIFHRDQRIDELVGILAPALKGERPSNVFVYGSVGTGKTLVIRHVSSQLVEVSKQNGATVTVLYVNCKMKKVADTEYRLLAQLARELGEEIPVTGLPTDEVYTRFFQCLEGKGGVMVLVLDEVDALVSKAGDEFMYNLMRINDELDRTQVSIIGISNDLNFTDRMDARVRSSLAEEELIFPPYNAIQLKDILTHRAALGFTAGVISPGVIEKCAALAAQEHGDARRALDLLRVAGELCERKGEKMVRLDHVDTARDRIEKDRIIEIVRTQPKHTQAVLSASLTLSMQSREGVRTGDVYNAYRSIIIKTGLTPLTQRRVSDLLSELDTMGIINAQLVSKGRYGRTKSIRVDLSEEMVDKLTALLKPVLS